MNTQLTVTASTSFTTIVIEQTAPGASMSNCWSSGQVSGSGNQRTVRANERSYF